MFGRDSASQVIPYTPERECEDAVLFFERMQKIHSEVAQAIMAHHQAQAAARNATQVERESYQIGDLVWVLKSHTMSSQAKLEPIWRGPLKIHQRTGHHSYVVQDKAGACLSVHVDWLKPYVPLGEVGELAGLEELHRVPHSIRGMRDCEDGGREYLVQWLDNAESPSSAVWVPHSHLVALGHQGKVEEYHQHCATARLS